VSLSNVRATPGTTLIVPGLNGEYVVTEHARNQLGRLLGLSWDRFFRNATSHDRAEELNRRLARAEGVVKVRSAKRPQGGCDIEAAGVIKAFVSPTYTPIADSAVANVIREALVEVEPEPRLVRTDITELTASYVVRLGQPFRVGRDGTVGDVWGGLVVKNSGVGFSCLSVSLHLTRIACTNGLVLPLPDASLVRWVHRSLDIGRIRERIVAGLDGVAGKIHRGAELLEASTRHRIHDAEREIRDVLRQARLPLGLVSDIVEAYRKEPNQSRFGISQALTLAAQRVTPEVRHDLERAAGVYVAQG
jgi:hypothetical protein